MYVFLIQIAKASMSNSVDQWSTHVYSETMQAPAYPAGIVWQLTSFEPAIGILERCLSEEQSACGV